MTLAEELQQLVNQSVRTKLSLEHLLDCVPVSHQPDVALLWEQAMLLAQDLQELKHQLDAAEDN